MAKETNARRKELRQKYVDELRLWMTPITKAMELLVGFGDALGKDWVKSESVRVFEAAIAHEDIKVAGDIVALYADTLGKDWTSQAQPQVAQLREAKKKAQAQ